MEQNYIDHIGLRRARVIIRYPDRNNSNGMRWSKDTDLIHSGTSSGMLIPISRIWSATAYIPFPAIDCETLNLPLTPVISEEQNATLEMHSGAPLLHLTMWAGSNNQSNFINKSYNLCLGIQEDLNSDEDIWETCRKAVPEQISAFIPPPAHILHRSTRQHFFDVCTKETEVNNLPVLMVKAGKAPILLKSKSDIITTTIVSCLQGRIPFVIKALGDAIRAIESIAPFKEWRIKLFDCLHKLLWSGKYDNIAANIIAGFIDWCKQSRHYPAWALKEDSLQQQPKHAYIAWNINSAAIYDHDYELPHLSAKPLVEEVRILTCNGTNKEFVWKPGYTRSSLLTSAWLQRKLELRNQTIEVKTKYSLTGTRLKLPQY